VKDQEKCKVAIFSNSHYRRDRRRLAGFIVSGTGTGFYLTQLTVSPTTRLWSSGCACSWIRGSDSLGHAGFFAIGGIYRGRIDNC